VPTNAHAAISLPPDSRSTDAIVRRWVVAIAELCGKELTKPLIDLWCQLLSDLEPELLDRALEDTARTCTRFFPTPGEIRARIKQADTNALQLKAEQAWQRVFKFAVNPHFSGIRELDRISDHAARAAGGLSWIESCPEDQLQWAKKKFIEAYLRIHELGQGEHLLTDGEAKQFVRELGKRANGPQALPAASESASEKES
jgi:hypothetical protein